MAMSTATGRAVSAREDGQTHFAVTDRLLPAAAGDDDAGERGQAAARVPVPVARPDRLPARLRYADAGLRAHAPRLPRVRGVPRPHGPRQEGRPHLHGR